MKKRNLLFFAGLIFAAVLLSVNLNAQPWMQAPYLPANKTQPAVNGKNIQPPSYNFYDIQAAFSSFWQGKTPYKGSGYNIFKRWEAWMEPQVYPTGKLPDMKQIEKEISIYKNQQAAKANSGSQSAMAANWTPLGPYGTPDTTLGGMKGNGGGRVDVIQFQPGNNNIVWIGTPHGGLWKSTDGGATWNLAVSFPVSNGVADIAIAPSNTNIIYVASGDGDASPPQVPTRGVWKSTDGGNTFTLTGLTMPIEDQATIYRLIVHPTNADIALAATNYGGIWRTADGGANWTKSTWVNPPNGQTGYQGCSWSDMEFNTADPNIVYAAKYGPCGSNGAYGNTGVYRSTDGGISFNYAYSFGADGGRISIAVTPANSNKIYALVAKSDGSLKDVYVSNDGGSNFTYTSNSNLPNFFAYDGGLGYPANQGWYDNSLAVSPLNANEVWVGGIDHWKSTDGGITWAVKTKYTPTWTGTYYNASNAAVVHTDVHALEYVPGTSTLFAGNDGGIFKTSDGGTTWTNLNGNMNTHLAVRLAGQQQYPGLISVGYQDNGTMKLNNNGSWYDLGGGDGHDCMINYNNPQVLYISNQNGSPLQRSTDGGATFANVNPNLSGAWITPYMMHRQNPLIVYAGYDKVYKATNGAATGPASWTAISPAFGSNITFMDIDNSGNTIYASTDVVIKKTTDGGTNWTDITAGLPVAQAKISFLITQPSNPANVWVTFNGYSAGNKVFFSSNGGSTWTNISGTLPNIPMQSIILDLNSSNHTLYLGSNMGVFHKDDAANDWTFFNTGMPDMPIRDLEINYNAGKLRAATYGRGIWETPISTSSNPPSATPCTEIKTYPSLAYDAYYCYAGSSGNCIGHIYGHNTFGRYEFAEAQNLNGAYSHVMGVSFKFHSAVAGSASSKITAKMWKNDGPNGMPGTVLASKDVLISQIVSDVSNGLHTQVLFDAPVAANSPYYIGFEVYNVSGDNVGLKSSFAGQVATNTAWVKSNGVWVNTEQWWGAGWKLSMAAFSVVGNVPVPDFTANPTSGGPGTVVNFTNNTTNGNAFKWTFSGINPDSSYALNPSITYNAAGSYTVKLKAYGSCNGVDSITKVNYITIGAPALSANVTHVSCNGGSNGTIDLVASGNSNTYTWSNGATTEDISGLTAGSYAVTVSSGGSSSTLSVTVNQPAALSVSGAAVNINCNGGNTGSIDVSVTGGTSPYTYSWSNGNTTQDISGLTATAYTVTVTDAKGCTATHVKTITQPPAITSTFSVSNASCGSNNGAVDLTVSGGTSPYAYSWSNGAVSTSLNGLQAGNYTVTITDNKNCTKTATAAVSSSGAPSIAVTSITNVSCNGGSNGSIDITPSGGSTPYSYSWSNNSTTQDVSGLAAGSYAVTVTDASSCSYNTSVNITQPAAMSVTVSSQTHVSCNGGNNGSASITVNGGTAPYTYLWSNNATTKDLVNLSAGTYTVTVTSAGGCTATASATITQPSALTASIKTITPVSCNGGSDGAVDINTNGGSSPLTYNWSNGASTQDIAGISAGTYNVTVTDKNGCISALSATVIQPLALSATLTKTNANCYGGTNGSVSLAVNGGASPYSYTWNTGAVTQNLSGLSANAYAVTVTDNKGCKAYQSVNVSEPDSISISLVSSSNTSCAGGNNGAINIGISGGLTPYSYSWSNGAATEDLNGLTAGTYTVTVTAPAGCTKTKTITITQPAAIAVMQNSVTNVSCSGGNNGSIDINVTGGTSPYTYNWSNGITTQDISGLGAGSYSVTVTGTGGCSTTFTKAISQPAAITVSSSVTDAACGNNNGAVDLSIAGGSSPYTYSWNTGATTQDISSLSAGNYSVRNAYGITS